MFNYEIKIEIKDKVGLGEAKIDELIADELCRHDVEVIDSKPFVIVETYNLPKTLLQLEEEVAQLKKKLYREIRQTLESAPLIDGVHKLSTGGFTASMSTIASNPGFVLSASYYNNEAQVRAVMNVIEVRDMGIEELRVFLAKLIKESRVRSSGETIMLNQPILAAIASIRNRIGTCE